MNIILSIFIILFIFSTYALANNHIYSNITKEPTCSDELLLKEWLPTTFNVVDPIGFGHYHLGIYLYICLYIYISMYISMYI
jgi:hypothetical protein